MIRLFRNGLEGRIFKEVLKFYLIGLALIMPVLAFTSKIVGIKESFHYTPLFAAIFICCAYAISHFSTWSGQTVLRIIREKVRQRNRNGYQLLVGSIHRVYNLWHLIFQFLDFYDSTRLHSDNQTIRARFYFSLRFYLHKKRRFLRLVQALRAYMVLGPLRKPIVQYYQKFGRNDRLKTDTHSLFPEVDTEQIVRRINEVGYAHVGIVPEEYVTQILDYCAIHKQTCYWNPHTNCEAVNRICRNAKLVEIAREYLGAEPILWLTLLRWSFPFSDDRVGFYPTTYRDPTEYEIYTFHYDIIDFKSLTLFVYLTDIDSNYGARVVVEGTHNNKSFEDLNNRILGEDVAKEKYGDRIKVILGKKGTAFFEETSTYHKVEICKSRRLILSINYVLQRKAPFPFCDLSLYSSGLPFSTP
jgi:hypothetical protein